VAHAFDVFPTALLNTGDYVRQRPLPFLQFVLKTTIRFVCGKGYTPTLTVYNCFQSENGFNTPAVHALGLVMNFLLLSCWLIVFEVKRRREARIEFL